MPSIGRTRRRPGYSLIELVVASLGASVLAVGLASALSIASQSVTAVDGAVSEDRRAHRALAQLHRDAQEALAMSELTATAVTMTVPDRDGDLVPEIIRYAWSGTTGDPLTMTYNGQTPVDIATDVQAFDLTWQTRFMEGVSNLPTVLFVSGETASGGETIPSASEQLRVDLMVGWGYDVQFISDSQSVSDFTDALADVNVVYVSGEVSPSQLSTKLYAAAVGVVTESLDDADNMEIVTGGSHSDGTQIQITSTSHYITEAHTLGPLVIASDDVSLKAALSVVASGATELASANFFGTQYPSLLTVEAGSQLADGNNAAARRAMLPWGDDGIDFTRLNASGQDLMKRTIEWASGAGGQSEQSGIAFEEYTDAAANDGFITIATPSGTAEGDLLIAAVCYDGANGFQSPPAGWTQIVNEIYPSRLSFGVWWKLASASEPSDYSFNWGAADQAYGYIMRFTGHDDAAPIGNIATSVNSSSSSPQSPAVTTTVDDAMVLRLGAFDDDDVNIGDTGLSGHTTITMNESGTGFLSCSGGAGYVLQDSAGSSGTNNFALTANEESVTATIELKPATP